MTTVVSTTASARICTPSPPLTNDALARMACLHIDLGAASDAARGV